jgi:hypothetical protein
LGTHQFDFWRAFNKGGAFFVDIVLRECKIELMVNQIVTKKERVKLSVPLKKLRNERAWMKLEKLGEKITRAWKNKKTALELIIEGRR